MANGMRAARGTRAEARKAAAAIAELRAEIGGLGVNFAEMARLANRLKSDLAIERGRHDRTRAEAAALRRALAASRRHIEALHPFFDTPALLCDGLLHGAASLGEPAP